ncbi:MAG: YihA family ribosome biogenesis GTP-binding protein [Ignavibacteria bacterium]|nr:YihA family ribosome biogenesis GTP-binding protein [Ignavibacteria bacterium]
MADDKHIEASFIKGAVAPEQFPVSNLPEVAMVGRSNVGKSSLINVLVRRSGLARVSNTPGKTREINFFSTDRGFVLVDLPGYGYAQVSKTRREEFASIIDAYLFHRENLALVCVLVDARHDPMTSDLSLLERLEFEGRTYAVILTKSDKLKPAQLQERLDQFRTLLELCKFNVDVIPSSAHSTMGRSEILGMMKRLINEFKKALS